MAYAEDNNSAVPANLISAQEKHFEMPVSCQAANATPVLGTSEQRSVSVACFETSDEGHASNTYARTCVHL